MKNLIISQSDLPTEIDILHTIARLRKDYRILAEIKGCADIESAGSFLQIIGFLEVVSKMGKGILPLGIEERNNPSLDIAMNYAATALTEAGAGALPKYETSQLCEIINKLKHTKESTCQKGTQSITFQQ